MTDARQTPDPDEKALLAHFRQHQGGTPPDHLDAFILATARREAPKMRPNLWRRWLQACQRPRWQVAFASFGGIAMVLTLVINAPQPASEQAAAPTMSPSTSALMESPSTDMPRPALRGALSAPVPAPMVSMADQNEPVVQQKKSAPKSEAETVRFSGRSAKALSALDKDVQEVLNLRRLGRTQEADTKWAELRKRHSSDELEARIKALQQ